MATWKVIGADRDTDGRVEIVLSAPDEPSALLAALLRGVYVARICQVDGPAAPTGSPSPAPYPAAAANPFGESAARKASPRLDAATTPARPPSRETTPRATPMKGEDPVKPAARPGGGEPTRV